MIYEFVLAFLKLISTFVFIKNTQNYARNRRKTLWGILCIAE